MSMGSLMTVLFVCLALLQLQHYVQGAVLDPAYGFTSLPLNSSDFHVQRPYDVPESARYSFTNGTHKFWVLASDKPHFAKSRTAPRTEIGILNHGYSSGVWQFEGRAYVPAGTSGVCIMQIFGASRHATTLMLHVYNGALMYYKSQLVADEIYGRWFRVNVIHDVGLSQLKIFIDGQQKLVTKGRGGKIHTFKFGAYSQNRSSYFMESQWKDIRVLKLHG